MQMIQLVYLDEFWLDDVTNLSIIHPPGANMNPANKPANRSLAPTINMNLSHFPVNISVWLITNSGTDVSPVRNSMNSLPKGKKYAPTINGNVIPYIKPISNQNGMPRGSMVFLEYAEKVGLFPNHQYAIGMVIKAPPIIPDIARIDIRSRVVSWDACQM